MEGAGSRAFTWRRDVLHDCYSHMQKSHLPRNAAALVLTANQIVPAVTRAASQLKTKIAWKHDEHERLNFASVGLVRHHFPLFEPSLDRMGRGLSEYPRCARAARA